MVSLSVGNTMTTTEIGLLVGFATLVVERIAAHFRAQAWVTRLVESLVADLRREHAECQKKLAKIESILVDITPVTDQEPAE